MKTLLFLFFCLPCCGQMLIQSGSLGSVTIGGAAGGGGGGSRTPDLRWYKFAEGSGTDAADSSEVNSKATLGTGTTWVTGASGSGYGIKGGGANTALATDAAVAYGTNKITICFWVNVADYDVAVQGFFYSSSVWAGGDRMVGFYNDSYGACEIDLWGDYTSQQFVSTGNVPATGAWHHMAFACDNSAGDGAVTIYMDGSVASWTQTENGTGITGPANFNNGTFYLGGRSASTAPADFSFDDVRIYTGLLTAEEVAAVYADPQ